MHDRSLLKLGRLYSHDMHRAVTYKLEYNGREETTRACAITVCKTGWF